jgi:hypothetical protein
VRGAAPLDGAFIFFQGKKGTKNEKKRSPLASSQKCIVVVWEVDGRGGATLGGARSWGGAVGQDLMDKI